jgi:CheY-like chemotaxis protein/anti-sigma regulatory factor (Ser/Thr protein kinase)
VDVGPDTPERVVCDETRLLQVLVNLLGNAAKYNRPGGKARLECTAAGGELHFSVSDTGLGMTPEQLAHLYEPFNRLGRETGRIEGTGIGLVITHHLVGLMHGRLEATSEPGMGTRFVVVLPLARVADDTGLSSAVQPLAALAPGRGRVLYVEDNEVNAQLMRAMLRQRPDVELRICGDATSGLAEAHGWRPQLLLLDMHLPDASGEEVLAKWRADPVLRGIPVVVVSADATQAQIDATLQRGAQAYLTKPLVLQQTLRAIDGLLGAPATTTEAAAG